MTRRNLGRSGLAAVFAASLGFGVLQALASPAPARAEALACVPSTCSSNCIRHGFDGGACINGQCFCYIITP